MTTTSGEGSFAAMSVGPVWSAGVPVVHRAEDGFLTLDRRGCGDTVPVSIEVLEQMVDSLNGLEERRQLAAVRVALAAFDQALTGRAHYVSAAGVFVDEVRAAIGAS